MKKILTLICAVALVSGASAQVQQARGTNGAPLKNVQTVSSPLMAPAFKGVAKSSDFDTIETNSTYEAIVGGADVGYGATNLPIITVGGQQTPDWNNIGRQPSVFFRLGTGWMNCIYGGGELGYSLDFREGYWYDYMTGGGIADKRIAGAIAFVGRASSTVAGMDEKEMPLKFKHYSYPKGEVKLQAAYTDLTSNTRMRETRNVRYPWDPTLGTFSETVYVPVMEPTGNNRMGAAWFGARFTEPAVAGEWPCVSVIFPTERNAEDSLWNVTLYEAFTGDDQISVTSETWGPIYIVYDFNYQEMWGHKDEATGEFIYAREERWEMIPDSLDQPNPRYAVVPMRSYNYTDQNGNNAGACMDGEPFMRLVLAEATDIERGAAYDKYVEVKKNPAINYTVLQSTDRIQSVEIYTLNGKLVKTQACNSHVETISLSGLTSGMYIAKVTTEAGIANKKIMVR